MTTDYKYSALTRGWYRADLHGSAIPADAVDVPLAEYRRLRAAESDGLEIVPGPGGYPAAQLRPPTADELLKQLTDALQGHLDSVASSYGYDNIYTAISYAEEPAVPKFQAEGQAFRAWRSLFWAAANAVRADVEAGSRPIPTLADLLAELPPFTAPASS